jgi:hypothetical protein
MAEGEYGLTGSDATSSYRTAVSLSAQSSNEQGGHGMRVHLLRIGRSVRFQGDSLAFHKSTRHGRRTLHVWVVGPVALIAVIS